MEVAKHGIQLSFDDVGTDALHCRHAHSVLSGHGGDCRGGIGSESGDSFDVGLYAGTTTRIATGY